MIDIQWTHPLLRDLRPLQMTDLPVFRTALADGEATGWTYYFPFLLFVRLGSKSTRYVWTYHDGSICVFRHQYRGRSHLDLAFPPCPYQGTALRHAVERVTAFNQSDRFRIYWVDEQDVPHLRKLGTFNLSVRNPQYLVSPSALAKMEGARFRTLRRNVNQAMRQGDIVIKPYSLEYFAECRQLLNLWENQKSKDQEGLAFQRRYALNSFLFCPQMDDRDLRGYVYIVNGRVRAFTFGGEIRPSVGCLMLAIADPRIPCLSYFVRQHFFAAMQECRVVNDGSDLGDAGLRAMKRRFRPSCIHTSYIATQVSGRSS